MAGLSVILTVGFCFLAAVPVAALWRSSAARLTMLGIASFGALVVVYQFLGSLAALVGAPLVTRNGALLVSGILCAISWAVRLRASRHGRWPRSSGEHADRSGGSTTPVTAPARGRVWVPVVVIVVGFLAFAVASGLSAPPRGWDVLCYHLPRAVSWLLHGDLGPYGSTGAFYPGNAEFPILTLFLTGSDRLVPLIQLPFALLAGVALFGLARAIGASARSAALSVLVLLLAPIVFFQATIAKDDVVVTALVLSGALFLVRSLRSNLVARERLREVTGAGFALGLALGTKYSILPYVMASVPVLLFVHLMKDRGASASGTEDTSRRHAAWRAVGVFVAAAAVPSAFWFARNAVVAGNPIEPLPPGLGRWVTWEGLGSQLQFIPRPALWWFFPWIDRQLVAGYNGAAGYGAAFSIFFVPGLTLCLWSVWRGRSGRGTRLGWRLGRERLALLLAIAVGTASWWFGKHHLPRLLLPIAGLACAPVALVFDAATRRARGVLVAVLAVALAFSGAETLRIAFRGRDITWTHRGGVDRREFYGMPDLIYELPRGTRILLLKPSADDIYRTYRYPLVGDLPGNDVVMEDDVGVGLNLLERGAVLGHIDLHSRGIDYIFTRIQSHRQHTTWFDAYPNLYEKVVDLVEPGHPWYREAYAIGEDGEIVGRALVITKMYRVLPRPNGIGWEGASPEPAPS